MLVAPLRQTLRVLYWNETQTSDHFQTGIITTLNIRRIIHYAAHLTRTIGKSAVYLIGSIVVRPFILLPRRQGAPETSRSLQILYVSLAYRGDFVLSLPAIMALKRQFPYSTITCWIRGFNQSLARLNPAIDQVLVYDDFRPSGIATLIDLFHSNLHQMFLRSLRDRKFDIMVDDSGVGFAAIYGFRAGIPLRIGRNTQGYGFLNHFDLPEDANCQLIEKRMRLLQPLGIINEPERTIAGALSISGRLIQDTLHRFALKDRRYFTVQPNGCWEAKNWPLERMAEVAGRLALLSQMKTVLLGSDRDRNALDNLGRSSGGPFLNLAGELELDELAAIISNSSLHLGVDSIGSHLACALGTKSLTIFGPTNPVISHSFSSRNIAIFKRTRCTPRFDRQYCCLDAGRTCPHKACMHELKVDDVLRIALQLLESEMESSLIEL